VDTQVLLFNLLGWVCPLPLWLTVGMILNCSLVNAENIEGSETLTLRATGFISGRDYKSVGTRDVRTHLSQGQRSDVRNERY